MPLQVDCILVWDYFKPCLKPNIRHFSEKHNLRLVRTTSIQGPNTNLLPMVFQTSNNLCANGILSLMNGKINCVRDSEMRLTDSTFPAAYIRTLHNPTLPRLPLHLLHTHQPILSQIALYWTHVSIFVNVWQSENSLHVSVCPSLSLPLSLFPQQEVHTVHDLVHDMVWVCFILFCQWDVYKCCVYFWLYML